MERLFEVRGKYNIAYYAVSVDEEMKALALQFAKDIILSDNQFSRLLPSQIRESRDVRMQQKIEIQRTYMGKLGELAFVRFLREMGKHPGTEGMLTVYEGQDNVDEFDFQTADGRSVDVKTGFRANHKRLLINTQQFDGDPKDIYVAVKLNATDVDAEQKLVDWDSVTKAEILGYSDYDFLAQHAEIRNFGEGPARAMPYNRLMGIDRLVKDFD